MTSTSEDSSNDLDKEESFETVDREDEEGEEDKEDVASSSTSSSDGAALNTKMAVIYNQIRYGVIDLHTDML